MRRYLLTIFGLVGLLLAYGYLDAVRVPVVVGYAVRSAAWTGLPLRIALLSDTHAVLPDMPPTRLAHMCEQVSALHPDLVLLAGDFVGRTTGRTGAVSPADATAPFAHCRARLGVFAVLGNHDMRVPGDAARVTAGLRRAGVAVLRNASARAGPLWIAGVDDPDTGHPDFALALKQVPPGAPTIMIFHNPDLFEGVPPGTMLSVAGHTHGGQVAPFGYRPVLPIVHRAWARGLVHDRGMPMVVTSGVGASAVPIRIGVPPEIALITLVRDKRGPRPSP